MIVLSHISVYMGSLSVLITKCAASAGALIMDRGYIKLWRKIIDSRIFRNEGLLKVWIWCLTKAAHENHWTTLRTGTGSMEVKVLPGQFIFGRDSAAKELHMPPSTVWKRINKLKKVENLNIESNRQYSLISVMNWPTYQGENNKRNIESNRQGTGREQAGNTNKNVKNVKNKYNSRKVPCPQKQILDLYCKILPELTPPKSWDGARASCLRARWNEKLFNSEKTSHSGQTEYWEGFFKFIRKSDFLMGKVEPKNGHRYFQADLAWIVKKTNFLKIIEGKYANKS